MRGMCSRALAVSMMILVGSAAAQTVGPSPNDGLAPLLRLLPAPEAPNLSIGTTLHTAPLFADFFRCLVVNVGNDPILVRAKIYDDDGAEVTEFSSCEEATNPRAKCESTAKVSGEMHCSITVTGSKENVRAVLMGTTEGYTSLIPPTLGQFIPPRTMTSEAR